MPELLLRGQQLGDVKGVLFDKDGTLSNSEEHLLSLANLRIREAVSLLTSLGKSESQQLRLESLLSYAYGLTANGLKPGGTIAIASRNQNLISTATVFCLLGFNWPQALEQATEIFKKVDYIESAKDYHPKKRTLLPGVVEVLQKLNQRGFVCAVISNDTRIGIENFLMENSLSDKITHFWSAEDDPPKPNPKAVKGLCESLGIKPRDCALIGDAESDLYMASQAGVQIVLGYLAGWTNEPVLTGHHHLIYNWKDLEVRATNPKVQNNNVAP